MTCRRRGVKEKDEKNYVDHARKSRSDTKPEREGLKAERKKGKKREKRKEEEKYVDPEVVGVSAAADTLHRVLANVVRECVERLAFALRFGNPRDIAVLFSSTPSFPPFFSCMFESM